MSDTDFSAYIGVGSALGAVMYAMVFFIWSRLNKLKTTVNVDQTEEIGELKVTQGTLILSNAQLQTEVISLMKTVNRLEKVEAERDVLKKTLDDTQGKLVEALKTVAEQDKVIKDAQAELTTLRNDLRDSQHEKARLEARMDGMKDLAGVLKVALPEIKEPDANPAEKKAIEPAAST